MTLWSLFSASRGLLGSFISQQSFLVSLPSGVNTSDIITLYISAIKALRELDPSMVILEVACEPIRKYLRWGFGRLKLVWFPSQNVGEDWECKACCKCCFLWAGPEKTPCGRLWLV